MGNISEPNSPAYLQLAEGQHFLLGDLMRPDGAGFLSLHGVSVTLSAPGAGATLDAERRGRFFFMVGGSLTLTNLRMVNGLAQAHKFLLMSKTDDSLLPNPVHESTHLFTK